MNQTDKVYFLWFKKVIQLFVRASRANQEVPNRELLIKHKFSSVLFISSNQSIYWLSINPEKTVKCSPLVSYSVPASRETAIRSPTFNFRIYDKHTDWGTVERSIRSCLSCSIKQQLDTQFVSVKLQPMETEGINSRFRRNEGSRSWVKTSSVTAI